MSSSCQNLGIVREVSRAGTRVLSHIFSRFDRGRVITVIIVLRRTSTPFLFRFGIVKSLEALTGSFVPWHDSDRYAGGLMFIRGKVTGTVTNWIGGRTSNA